MTLTLSPTTNMKEQIRVPLESLEYPPRFELGTMRTTAYPLSNGNAIKMFCETVQGERPLLPNWGLPQIIHTPAIQSEETEAVILSCLRVYFDADFVINCQDVGLGQKVCKIEYSFDDSTGFIVIEL